MGFINKIKLSGVFLLVALMFGACGSSGSGGGGGGDDGHSGSTLTGDVTTFTASLNLEKKSFFAQFKDFLLSSAYAAVSGVTVAVGGESTTTDADGHFTLSDIETGDQTVTFTQGTDSATYSLNGVGEGETFTLNDVVIAGTTVSTALTGTWSGPIDLGDATFTLVMEINANGNSLSGSMAVTGDDESGSFSGTENGSVLEDTTYEATGLDGCEISGPLTGTFSGDTLTGNAPITADSCGLEPGDSDPDSHAFTLTKS